MKTLDVAGVSLTSRHIQESAGRAQSASPMLVFSGISRLFGAPSARAPYHLVEARVKSENAADANAQLRRSRDYSGTIGCARNRSRGLNFACWRTGPRFVVLKQRCTASVLWVRKNPADSGSTRSEALPGGCDNLRLSSADGAWCDG